MEQLESRINNSWELNTEWNYNSRGISIKTVLNQKLIIIAYKKIWRLTELEYHLIPAWLPFIEPGIDMTTTRRQNCPAFSKWARQILSSCLGHHWAYKANRSRAGTGQELDNADYLYTFLSQLVIYQCTWFHYCCQYNYCHLKLAVTWIT